jgi:NAD(P)-dependent dehydrogenase (short-subunit alcohol dehydrogenase family)
VGELDVLINNAGILLPTATDPAEEHANLHAMMQVHLHGPLQLVDILLPALQRSRHPIVVNVISMSAFVNVSGCEAYCTSKAALHSATQGLRVKYPDIRCVGIYPGPTATDMTAGSAVTLADPADSAGAIIAGMIDGETSIFPDPAARAVESVIGASVTALEAQFAGLLVE